MSALKIVLTKQKAAMASAVAASRLQMKPYIPQYIFLLLAVFSIETSAGSLWIIESQSTHLYIAGSIHKLKPNSIGDISATEKAFLESDLYISETGVNFRKSNKIPRDCSAVEIISLEERFGKDLYQKLETAIKENLRDPEKSMLLKDMDKMGTRHIMSYISEFIDRYNGITHENGVDTYFLNKALGGEKLRRVVALDNLRERCRTEISLHYLENKAETLEAFLNGPLGLSSLQYNKMVDSWRDHNKTYFETQRLKESATFPAWYQHVIAERNRRWLRDIDMYLSGNLVSFILVGELHLYGVEGLPNLLSSKGYVVRELQ